jgi:hypothetical protein
MGSNQHRYALKTNWRLMLAFKFAMTLALVAGTAITAVPEDSPSSPHGVQETRRDKDGATVHEAPSPNQQASASASRVVYIVSWRLNGNNSWPGYRGKLWVDKANGQVRRLTRVASKENGDIDAWVPYVKVATEINYGEVDIAGLGKFLLPVRSEMVSCERGMPACNHNVLTFKNCCKFAAKSRILTDSPQP